MLLQSPSAFSGPIRVWYVSTPWVRKPNSWDYNHPTDYWHTVPSLYSLFGEKREWEIFFFSGILIIVLHAHRWSWFQQEIYIPPQRAVYSIQKKCRDKLHRYLEQGWIRRNFNHLLCLRTGGRVNNIYISIYIYYIYIYYIYLYIFWWISDAFTGYSAHFILPHSATIPTGVWE